MRRIVFCLAVLTLIVIVCFAGFLTVLRCEQEIVSRITDMEEHLYELSFQELSERSAQLYTTWEKTEKIMARYLRRNSLDEVTGRIAGLEKLAHYGELPQFCAELDRIRAQLHHLCESAAPYWRNIL